jgi:hypothetical protein
MSVTPDMLFHMGGVPVGGPVIPHSAKVYFVDTKNGSDGSQGRRADNALATIARAITLVNANISWSASPWAQRDVIYIMPGTYAENITSMPYGAIMIGAGNDIRDGENGVKIKPASGDPVDCASIVNTEIYNIGFESPDTGAAFDAAICNNVLFQNCLFTGAAEATTAVYGFWTSDCVKTTFRNCWFCNADNGAYFTYTDAGDSISYLLMENCIITGCSATGIYTHTNLVGPHSVVRNCHISGSGQTLTIGIDDNAGVIDESFNAIEATTAVDGVRSSNGSYGNGVLLT